VFMKLVLRSRLFLLFFGLEEIGTGVIELLKQALSILWRLHKGICHIFNSKFLNLFAPCLQMPLNLVIGHKILSLRLLLEAHFVSRKWRDISEGGNERQGTFRAVDHFNNKLIINSQKTKSLTICCRVFVTLADFLL